VDDLFSEQEALKAAAPLAERMRPRTLDEFLGQGHLIGPDRLLNRLVTSGALVSLLFWGPPGSGKTTLARLVAGSAQAEFLSFSAVLTGVKEVREVVEQAREGLKFGRRRTVLFVDEIHRFNKAQQDAFLPHVESGLLTLLGATTENPSFEVISPLLSRMRVLVLKPLGPDDLSRLVDRALSDPERGLGRMRVELSAEARDFLVAAADGDARILLNALELAVSVTQAEQGVCRVGLAEAEMAVQKKSLRYDRGGEEHYNLISALHKSLRDSDPDAALYWLARMLEAGEDSIYLLRRMVRFASEDVGQADPQALVVAVSAVESYRLLGSPEGDLALAGLAVYLSLAEKSNSIYKAFEAARKDAREQGSLGVPLHLRNAPTRLMKDLGYGRGYRYAHDYEDARVDQEHMPEELRGRRYYVPTGRGGEQAAARKLALRDRAARKPGSRKTGPVT
jgi:putative ATPase